MAESKKPFKVVSGRSILAKREVQQVVANRTNPVAMKGVGGPGVSPGKTLLTTIKEELDSFDLDFDGSPVTKRQLVAKSMVRMAIAGSFQHQKELLDRENGKVAERHAGADGENLKLYINLPEGQEP